MVASPRPAPFPARAREVLARFGDCTVAVVGDFVLDVYLQTVPERLSREAPVLIVQHQGERVMPGGAGNTVNNLRALGAHAVPVGVVGDDEAGRALRDHFRGQRVNVRGLALCRGRRTTRKTRVMVGDLHRRKQQVLRIDEAGTRAASRADEAALLAGIERLAPAAHAWVISDYGYGAITDRVLARLRRLARRVPVAADSRHQLRRYHGLTAVKPNEHEAAAAYGEETPLSPRRARALGTRMIEELGLESALITLGKEGLWCFARGRAPVRVPAWGGEEVTDVSGAGDTVAAAYTLALAAGADAETAARLANVAAGLVVLKEGTAVVTRDELRAALDHDG